MDKFRIVTNTLLDVQLIAAVPNIISRNFNIQIYKPTEIKKKKIL